MKKFVKLISLILALLMVLAAFAACGKKDDEKDKNDDPKDTVAKTEDSGGTDDSTESETVAPITPIDWEGREYRILGRESDTDWHRNWEIWRETLPDDIVGKSVWNRNQALLEKFNIKVVGYLEKKEADAATTSINSGTDLYDLIIMKPEAHHPHAMNGDLLDLYTLEYINMEHNGWMPYPNKQLTMGGKLFYTTNKFLVQDKNRSWSVFYNRDRAQELNLGYFEEWVFDGTWTIDKAIEIGKKATYDLDGQPGMGLEDHWGVAAASAYEFCSMAYGAGFRLSDHGPDGYPVLVGATDQMISILDKCYQLRSDPTAFYMDQDQGSIDWDYCTDHAFMAGRVVTLFVPISAIDNMRAKSDFTIGILPNPKYDEKQEQYHTVPNLGNGTLLSVPATVADPDFAGYALQAITEESVDTTYYTYIEEKSKLQNAYDEDVATCMGLIFDGVVYDIVFISNIGQLGGLARDTLGANKVNNYSRLMSRFEGSANAYLEKIKDAYKAMDLEAS